MNPAEQLHYIQNLTPTANPEEIRLHYIEHETPVEHRGHAKDVMPVACIAVRDIADRKVAVGVSVRSASENGLYRTRLMRRIAVGRCYAAPKKKRPESGGFIRKGMIPCSLPYNTHDHNQKARDLRWVIEIKQEKWRITTPMAEFLTELTVAGILAPRSLAPDLPERVGPHPVLLLSAVLPALGYYRTIGVKSN